MSLSSFTRVGIVGFFALLAFLIVPATASAQTAGCDLIGTDGPDVLNGTDADEVICGLGGDDVINGGGGNDRLLGGPGNDTIRGGSGNDTLLGGTGADELDGERGADRLNGQRGADILEGGRGRDRLLGGGGLDSCADAAGRTRARSCETGALLLERAEQRWAASGATEFVYARSVAEICPPDQACAAVLRGPEVIRVRGDLAIGERPTTVALTADELFAAAAAAMDAGFAVDFDAVHGLPVQYEASEIGVVYLTDLELRDDLRAAYSTALETWTERAVDSYSFVFRNICFCPGIVSVAVEVVDGEIVAEAPADEPLEEEEAWVPEAQTIDDHLARIGELLDGTNISVNAVFDEATGVPLEYGFDQSRLIADEELSVVIEDFTPTAVAEEPDDEPEAAEVLIVDVEGIQVNSEIAVSLAALLEAARLDGFNLSGGGFRDPAAQIALRRANCGTSDYAVWEMPASECSPPTARPGQSLHETGHAVDFTNDGALITSRASAAFVWLEANAPGFGFFNHPAEPWHWSINGN